MALLVLISAVTTFTALGQPNTNYVASVERVKLADCEKIKAGLSKQHVVVTCIKEGK
jgi:hypothetical protein